MTSLGSCSTSHSALGSAPSRTRERRLWLAAAAAIAIASLPVFWLYSRDDERQAIVSMPQNERTSLYQRTFEDLSTTCRVGDVALRAYCRRQAEFILKFPQCDATCQALAGGYLPHATR
jgi:cytochrome b pre-mRNA-processing protein 3